MGVYSLREYLNFPGHFFSNNHFSSLRNHQVTEINYSNLLNSKV